MAGERSSTWVMKAVISGLLGILFTGGTAWLVFGQDKITREELVEYVQTQSPYVHDRAAQTLQDSHQDEQIDKNATAIGKLAELQQQSITEQRVLVQKVDDFIEEQRNR